MSRGYSTHSSPRHTSSLTPYVLVVAGLVTFCIALLGPIVDVSSGLSITNIAAGEMIVLDGRLLVVSGGLLLISAMSTLFGVALLLLRVA
ncbi:hypothetical protein KU306_01835 [Haloferax larsenii]|uniref:Uncharacterized protein n=1 Tax=Haloferax larsenii TaxID=302484 RepID=A0ABY5RET2_HALLR|nr:hypothetical protein [Haloferax larsenii]ELZ78026.1 hypothetical protein C455_10093 [Haloferax larsenii JCM 13917]UVE50664.1 hypothetical protein KU306_01835 [Haloferax larsenii]